MEKDHIFIFLITTMVLSLSADIILTSLGFNGSGSSTLAIGAFLSLCFMKGSERGWKVRY